MFRGHPTCPGRVGIFARLGLLAASHMPLRVPLPGAGLGFRTDLLPRPAPHGSVGLRRWMMDEAGAAARSGM